ncbi:MAG TPA: CvpA family protein [Caulobacteraceae bacterium]|jgi:membrane protein required for colicin V production
MSLFDLGAGLVLIVSAIIGWFRGGSREVLGVAALVLAAVAGFAALRLTGPIARAAIHTAWIANLAAIAIVFAAVFVLLRAIAAAITRGIRQTALGPIDHAVGAGFGLARAFTVLGLATWALTAITPPERMPKWITGAFLYPLTSASADALKAFAPKGVALARQLAPAVGHAIAGDENRDTNAADASAAGVRVEQAQ